MSITNKITKIHIVASPASSEDQLRAKSDCRRKKKDEEKKDKKECTSASTRSRTEDLGITV